MSLPCPTNTATTVWLWSYCHLTVRQALLLPSSLVYPLLIATRSSLIMGNSSQENSTKRCRKQPSGLSLYVENECHNMSVLTEHWVSCLLSLMKYFWLNIWIYSIRNGLNIWYCKTVKGLMNRSNYRHNLRFQYVVDSYINYGKHLINAYLSLLWIIFTEGIWIYANNKQTDSKSYLWVIEVYFNKNGFYYDF